MDDVFTDKSLKPKLDPHFRLVNSDPDIVLPIFSVTTNDV